MKILGVVPARGGSKRVPNKNIADLGGKPLIAWTIEVALAACDKTIVTTDGANILCVSRTYGADVLIRPPELARDDTPAHPVIVHVVEQYPGFDCVALLQPTSPFRTVEDVKAALEIFDQNDADSVISVKAFQNDDRLFKMGHANRLRPAAEKNDLYEVNGAIYLIRTSHLLSGGDWYDGIAYGYVMPADRSLDIDTHADLDAARAMLERASPAV